MKMKQKLVGFLMIAFLMAAGTLMLMPNESEAVPVFSRQTGQACVACHYAGNYPALTAFGREFKSGGYTMVGGESLISGDVLSLPSVLNAGMVLKVRYQKTNGDVKTGKNQGELQFPDEAALWLGGRVGENIGFLMEGALQGGDLFTSFKMPFVINAGAARVSIIPFTTDALGAAFGFELLNTGAVRNIRVLEHRKEISAQQYISGDKYVAGTDGKYGGAAQGVALVLSHNMGYINYTAWIPNHEAGNAIHSVSSYLRAALTQQVGDWDLAGGVQWWGGTSTFDDAANAARTRAWALDAQAQGQVGNMPLGIYLSYASAEKSVAGETVNIFNSETNANKTAFTVTGQLGVIPNKAALTLAYRAADNGKSSKNKDNAITLGGQYYVAQNVKLELDYTSYSGSKYDPKPADGDSLATFMLFASF